MKIFETFKPKNEIVKQYIENQQTSERPKEKNKWKNYLKECEVKND